MQVKVIKEGISIKDNKPIFNYKCDIDDDLIKLKDIELYKSEFEGRFYCFGYKFTEGSSSNSRGQFIKWIKGLSDDKPTREQLDTLIYRPLNHLQSELQGFDFDCVIYPRSERSSLTYDIVKRVSTKMLGGTCTASYEMIKSLPHEIEFDWDKFYMLNDVDSNDQNRKNQIEASIRNLLNNIHSSNYFSIADSVKPFKYRKYIKNFLTASEPLNRVLKNINKGKILLIDDINTSGSTLHEILRVISSLNPDCEVYIFTLIGN